MVRRGVATLAAAAGVALIAAPCAHAALDLSKVPGLPEVQGITNSGTSSPTDPSVVGSFSAPFSDPRPADQAGRVCAGETEGTSQPADVTKDGIECRPAGVSVVVLPNGRLLYWDGLEGEEDINVTEVLEIGDRAVNDQSRVLTPNYGNLPGSSWSNPTPVDAGANDSAGAQYLLPNAPPPLDQVFNDPGNAPGALFCSDQVLLSNGEVLVPGGTFYYSEPHVPGSSYGLAELQGLTSTRIFNPANNTWSQTGDMNFGRWYPSLVTLGNGKVFAASGVTKLIKPVYPDRLLDSGTNVEETETYDPRTGRWSDNGAGARRSLPLYPRLHLLPDGKVYYDAGGQTFSPMGQSYDEALWNWAAVYDPQGGSWRNVGVPLGVSVDASRPLDTSVSAGFRGSSFSIMLPLTPPYTKAQFLSAGGVLGTTPGTYLANTSSVINTVDTARNDDFSSQATSPLNNARWFSTGVQLPTGQVIAFNGANRDEVVGPGTGFAVRQAELFDPGTRKWTRLASTNDDRTYHNTAVLLPTGQVLVGGNAPLSTLYLNTQTIPGGFSNAFRDPSYELYDPPYLKWGIPQPVISAVNGSSDPKSNPGIAYGRSITISTPDAAAIQSVALVRNTALTHTVDGDQRTVMLPITGRNAAAGTVTVSAPPSGNVAPPGPYMLFVNKDTSRGLVPSVARQTFVGASG